jgi:hypothetical protein
VKNTLSSINWRRDLGVHLNMLNSEMPAGRNEFYWEMLKEVQGRRCLEIGFGTGILSIIAIQRGAVHVEAWEQNLHRYHLGCHIIKELQLQDQITLHHGEYDKSQCQDSDLLVIHEIIGSNIWCEGMRSALPVGHNMILPGVYSMRFDVIAVDRAQFNKDFYPKREFRPAIPIDNKFKNLVQSLIDQSPEVVNRRDYYTEPVLDQLNFYHIDVNRTDSLPTSISKTYDASDYPTDHVLLFYPFASVSHNQHTLPWSWSDPVVITDPSNSITITQSLVTGAFYVEENP